jgi:hypothetical protein
MPNEFFRQSLAIRQDPGQVVREVPYVAGENDLALSVQGRGDPHPAREERLSGLEQLAVCRVADGSGVSGILCDAGRLIC